MNLVAGMQAWTMTHYARAGERTPPPEKLTFLSRASTILLGTTVPRPRNDHTPSDLGISFETRTIPAGGIESIEAWYLPRATNASVSVGPIVLLFTGYAESKESLLAQAAAMHSLGYEVLLADFRGAGGSTGADTTLGVREAEDVALATDYVKRSWPGRSVVLYGVSMGAAAVLRAVSVGGVQPEGLILESPFDSLLGTVGNRFHAMGLPAFPFAEMLTFWGSVEQGFNGFTHNPSEYAASVRCPTLLMHGDLDPRVTVGQNEAIFERLGGRKEAVNFADASHESLIAEAPEEWRNHVSSFLDQLH